MVCNTIGYIVQTQNRSLLEQRPSRGNRKRDSSGARVSEQEIGKVKSVLGEEDAGKYSISDLGTPIKGSGPETTQIENAYKALHRIYCPKDVA